MNKLKFVSHLLGVLVLIVSFQNCGKGGELRDGNLRKEEVLEENIGLFEPQSSSLPPTQSLPRISYVIPRSIDFGYIGNVYWDYYGISPNLSPVEPHRTLPPCQRGGCPVEPTHTFAYSLSLARGHVTDSETGDVLHELSADQKKQLKMILSGSVIAYPSHFLGPNAGNYACVAIYSPPYSSLNTNRGNFQLGGGSPNCELDLFKRVTGKQAGLREFLENLEAEFGIIGIAGN